MLDYIVATICFLNALYMIKITREVIMIRVDEEIIKLGLGEK